mmetsp:Transcript_4635/g.13794  ORF Transcript_4635/g.13794 Transcript_4635/m.13794 type:complete len:144 (-) Transcript_4635:56-487(-)
MSSLYGVNCYAKNRMPDGSGRDLMILLDAGYRMGRDQNGFGSMPRSPAPPHPFFNKMETRSLLAFDENWTDVHGKKPRSSNSKPTSSEPDCSPSLYRMRGGNYALILPKKAATTGPRRGSVARSTSLPSLTGTGDGGLKLRAH